jgi:hypothetical protein
MTTQRRGIPRFARVRLLVIRVADLERARTSPTHTELGPATVDAEELRFVVKAIEAPLALGTFCLLEGAPGRSLSIEPVKDGARRLLASTFSLVVMTPAARDLCRDRAPGTGAQGPGPRPPRCRGRRRAADPAGPAGRESEPRVSRRARLASTPPGPDAPAAGDCADLRRRDSVHAGAVEGPDG